MRERKSNGTAKVMLVESVSLIAAFAAMLIVNEGISEWEHRVSYFTDIPSILVILVLCIPVLAASGLWEDFLRAFLIGREDAAYKLAELKRTQAAVRLVQRQVVCAGLMNVSFAVIMLLHSLDMPETIGPYFAQAILSVFYVSIFEMLLLPLSVEVEKKIVNYMEAE